MKQMLTFFILFLASVTTLNAGVNALLPDSGRHGLIQHRFNQASACGTADSGLIFTKQGITLDSHKITPDKTIRYLSPITKLSFPAKELVLTWNALTPKQTWLHIQFRVKNETDDWSNWFDLADWRRAAPSERNANDDAYGVLEVDILKASKDFHYVQYRIGFYTEALGVAPTLKTVSLAYTQPNAVKDKKVAVEAPVGKKTILSVPWLSQLRTDHVDDYDLINAGVCAPTSITMAMNYYGKKFTVGDIARYAHDPIADIYGNWAFLVATAGENGFQAWVERFRHWKEVRRYVDKGVPVIVSVAYPKGTFSAAPDAESPGHLMVVKGFTKEGNVLVNNPGTVFPQLGESVIYPWDELGVAFFGHGGVGIIIQKSGK
jgi:hypothetical protein